MSDSQAYEEVSVSAEGVTVIKRFEADEFPVPAIAFNIESHRSEPVTITLADVVPHDVAVEDLGFHPEYGSEHWTIDEETITFEREIDVGTEYTTVYGIRATGTDNVEKFLTEPTIKSVKPPMQDEGDLVDDASSDLVRDVIAGESDSVPGLDETDDEEIETLDLADPNEESDAGSTQTSEETIEGVQPGAVAKTLAAEIRQGAVDDATLTVLEEELDLGTDDSAVDARIQHLQNEVSDLTAYTTALEEFLAENGQGAELIEDFRERLNDFEDELERIGSDVEIVDGKMASVETSVTEQQTTVSELESEVADVKSTVEDLSEQVGEATDLDERLSDVEEAIDNLQQWRDQLSSVIGGAE